MADQKQRKGYNSNVHNNSTTTPTTTTTTGTTSASGSSSRSKRTTRSRGPRGKLRRYNEIDHVMVEESFLFNEPLPSATDSNSKESTPTPVVVGEGCYVSATVNNRRFYGVLIDQAALKSASLLYFQHEAKGLELNRKMQALYHHQQQFDERDGVRFSNDRKRSISSCRPVETPCKRMKGTTTPTPAAATRQVQKFRYVEETGTSSSLNGNGIANSASVAVAAAEAVAGPNGWMARLPGYRILLATYASVAAAAEDDMGKMMLIEEACDAGGDFVGDYYYQYEVNSPSLDVSEFSRGEEEGMRMSLGFESFLQRTNLPSWFPLANLQVGQQKVLNMLSMKKDGSGNVVWDNQAAPSVEMPPRVRRTLIPMLPRPRYRVCVVGGGIAGLSSCVDLFRECDRENIDVEVILLEGRSRLGGRLWTDRKTFKCTDGDPFPVDLGASWIHGIELNPLAALAKEAGVEFVTTSEEVKMFEAGMKEVDKKEDEHAGRVFDKLLDLAADGCWGGDDSKARPRKNKNQAAVRWYASVLDGSEDKNSRPVRKAPPLHRCSSDVSVDKAIGNVIAKHKFSEFSRLSDSERRMLMWNLKNVEYALGANVSDLSMMWWDTDERHAFEGDHVILRQGYSFVVDYLLRTLQRRGERFRHHLNFPVGKVEYARRTTCQPYSCTSTRNRQFVELSDTCCVTSESGDQAFVCDFVVSAVPLGVLKEAVSAKTAKDGQRSLEFEPALPFPKQDAIESVGFGLLDKVYLQFPSPFWRRDDILEGDKTLFGNASGTFPHHYMFLDVGKTLHSTIEDAPAILMSLISGREAVKCECLTRKELIAEIMTTLRTIFRGINVPEPTEVKATRWGSDRFARGSYTFLPPGTSDQDFHLLQSPINGNGDSVLLEGYETMRLFFAGEHTTALHPSMAHGAMLSGARVAKEIISAMTISFRTDDSIDRLIPMAIYRHMNPKTDLRCSLCSVQGTTIREGTLLAFKKGSRQVLVHNNCAENSPEVEVFEGQWKHVLQAVTRSRTMECVMCGLTGASIGCSDESCFRCFHFNCAEDTGWRFDLDGKEFYCDLHRTGITERDDCDRISMKFYQSKQRAADALSCCLCGGSPGKRGSLAGQYLAFRQRSRMAVVHEKCARFTSIVDTTPDPESRFEQEYRNVFSAIDCAVACATCGKQGATIGCSYPSCRSCYHFICALDTGWNFDKRGSQFRCRSHRRKSRTSADHGDGLIVSGQEDHVAVNDLVGTKSNADFVEPKGFFRHALFCTGETAQSDVEVAGNQDTEQNERPLEDEMEISRWNPDDCSEDSYDDDDDDDDSVEGDEATLESRLTSDLDASSTAGKLVETMMHRLHRPSLHDRWDVEFHISVVPNRARSFLAVASAAINPFDQLCNGDIVTAINGIKIGSPELDSLEKVLARLRQEVEVMIQIRRLAEF